jgi:TetR/AcrR family transcriptional regulator, regulator of cefoperazone and chloramphenicol sensitivity
VAKLSSPETAWTDPILHPEDEHGKRRLALLEAAYEIIATAGFEGLRTRGVAEQVGVNIATLHYYFPSKQQLIEGLSMLIGAKFVTLHGPAPAPSGFPALDRLRQEFSDGRFYLAHHPDLLLVLQEFASRGKRDPQVQKVLDQMIRHWQTNVENIVRQGMVDGTFRSDFSFDEIFSFLMTILRGTAYGDPDQVPVLQRQTESWILSEQAKRQLTKRSRGKRK